MKEPIFDMIGNEIVTGSKIVYPTRFKGLEGLVIAKVVRLPTDKDGRFMVTVLRTSDQERGPKPGTVINQFRKASRCMVLH